jgi:hypothetical protein
LKLGCFIGLTYLGAKSPSWLLTKEDFLLEDILREGKRTGVAHGKRPVKTCNCTESGPGRASMVHSLHVPEMSAALGQALCDAV